MKSYINITTGEIVHTKTLFNAIICFIKSGRKVGYKVCLKDIKRF